MAKKKAKDLTPKGNDVKGGVMDRDVAGPGGRDVRRLKRGLQKTEQSLRNGVREIPK